MNRKIWSTLLTLALVVGLAGTAFAGNGTFNVSSDTTIQGKELRPGDYKVSWNENGEINLTDQKGAKFTVQGQVTERAEKSARTSVLTQNDAGVSQVKEVRFAGKKTVLVFESKVAQKQ